MPESASPSAAPRVAPPAAPALVFARGRCTWLSADGEPEGIPIAEAAQRVQRQAVLVCHARSLAGRLGLSGFRALDLLELYAFVRPARPCLPTPAGLALALGLPKPATAEDAALALMQAAERLLGELAADEKGRAAAARTAFAMGRGGWPWAASVLAATGLLVAPAAATSGFDVWNQLPEWEDGAPRPPPGDRAVAPEEARARLAELLGAGAEQRPGQVAFAASASEAFRPRQEAGAPHLVLAEAGTGVGKTLGYLAPASLWAQRNEGAVWISTYTRNLQRQVEQELERVPARAVVRMGRENYLCLLNLEDAAKLQRPGDAVALGLMARWARATRAGLLVGGDFPSWLGHLLGRGRTLGLADQRGECVYSACPHYRKCYIERSIRQAREADIVVANHALTIRQAARDEDGRLLPSRLVFDEGHHVFDAADGAFSAELSGLEGAELRRWLLGPEGGRRANRARGLQNRIGDLCEGDEAASVALSAALSAARALPGEGWLRRVSEGAPVGPTEGFLVRARAHVLARATEEESDYDLQAEPNEPDYQLLISAETLGAALRRIEKPLVELVRLLRARLADEAAELETAERLRVEATTRGIDWRARTLAAWRAMLEALGRETPEAFVDWLGLRRDDGREADVGLHRHWVDPTIPFAKEVLTKAHGALVTSATLKDRTDETPDDWSSAEVRTGALHLPAPAVRSSQPSPFDYAGHTRVFVVTDLGRADASTLAAACRELFLAAGGGALGLFTAVRRLRAVHARLAPALEQAGLPLYAQHVDGLDNASLIEMFRAEEDSCLLGTDAMRDGVDVPGRALRLIAFERVPWPRPDILHRARRKAFGGKAYDELLARLRLKQAYGRLVRRADDRGVFVMLDARTPTRLLTAFPEGVAVARVGLAEAVRETRAFLASREPG